jgi:Protein of unknown function (DUF2841)
VDVPPKPRNRGRATVSDHEVPIQETFTAKRTALGLTSATARRKGHIQSRIPAFKSEIPVPSPPQGRKRFLTNSLDPDAKTEDSSQDEEAAPSIFRIDDSQALEKFYEATFSHLQELAMKSILKAWIKEVEPKKSRKHPYCKKNESKPDFWPDGVEHTEPDHLKKDRELSPPVGYRLSTNGS